MGLPMMVYNIPGRSGVNIEPGTMARLAKLPQIAALKEASGSLDQMIQISRACGDDLNLLSGDDALDPASFEHRRKGGGQRA
jgi:4-hydroxy-tetrahydrodipicolinate synthase